MSVFRMTRGSHARHQLMSGGTIRLRVDASLVEQVIAEKAARAHLDERRSFYRSIAA
jgi:hypothetical protein